jgi:hypothetical protein
MGRTGLFALLGTIVVTACSNQGVPNAHTTPIACGAVSTLSPSLAPGHNPGVVIGPLFFDTFGARTDGAAVISDFTPGYPYKVLIEPTAEISTPVHLEGWKCIDGGRLRFWYHDGNPFSQVPVSERQLASTGDIIANIGPTIASPSGGFADYTGYMLFTGTGKWKIDVSRNQVSFGSAVFDVRAHP